MPRRTAGPRLSSSYALALAVVGTWGASACTGSIDGGSTGNPAAPGGKNSGPGTGPSQPGSPSGMSGATPGGTPPSMAEPLPPPGSNPLEPNRNSPACKEVKPGPAPARRLTRSEYDNTIRDLLGEDKKLAQAFPNEELQHSFDNNAELRSVSEVLAEKYFAAAEDIGKTAVGKLATILPCDPGKDGETVCLDKFFDGFGKRLWRRPLEASERDDLKKVFTDNKAKSFAEGLDAVIQVMVLSPQFMYRIERGVPEKGAN